MANHDVTGSARADLDTGTITRTVRVRAARETVWRTLTDPDQVVIWWGHGMRFPDGIRAGSLGTFTWAGHDDFPVRIDRVDPPTHFELTWGSGQALTAETSSTIMFELTTADDATLVTVTETGFLDRPDLAARRAAMEGNVNGWNEVLDNFVKHVESAPA